MNKFLNWYNGISPRRQSAFMRLIALLIFLAVFGVLDIKGVV